MAANSQSTATLEPVDQRLIDGFQRDFPLHSRPFSVIGETLNLTEDAVIRRYAALRAAGVISRIGALVAPNTLGASTLAAMAVPAERLEAVARLVSAESGVSHNYARENPMNLWFVVTGPDVQSVEAVIAGIEKRTGLPVNDLRLIEPYHLDLGFALDGAVGSGPRQNLHKPDLAAIRSGDRDLMAAIETGLPLASRPFRSIAALTGMDEHAILERLDALIRAAIIRRFGVVVKHRALGYETNAMAVWDVPDTDTNRLGKAFGGEPGVTLCYARRRTDVWPFNLYCMVHARRRDDALAVIDRLNDIAGETDGAKPRDHAVLFSTRCFKQTGARLSRQNKTVMCHGQV
ncbi:MAG TPA: Lrp/AsnC family transcriptional regulator [Afifellaceae bacterium]|nr:Lrp/AsnC family transcriptional regulator [Afifellaceae bacterium]